MIRTISSLRWILSIGVLPAAAIVLAGYASESVSYLDLFDWWDGEYRPLVWIAVALLGAGALLPAALLVGGVSKRWRTIAARRMLAISTISIGYILLHIAFILVGENTVPPIPSDYPLVYIWICLSLLWTVIAYWALYTVSTSSVSVAPTADTEPVEPADDQADEQADEQTHEAVTPVLPEDDAETQDPDQSDTEGDEADAETNQPAAPTLTEAMQTVNITIERGSNAAGTPLSLLQLPTGAEVTSISRNEQPLSTDPDTILAVNDNVSITAPESLASEVRAAFD